MEYNCNCVTKLITEEVCECMKILTETIVNMAKLYNRPSRIKKVVSRMIYENNKILKQLDATLPPCRNRKGDGLRCNASKNLTVDQFRDFLECVAAHSHIAYRLGLEPKFKGFMVVPIYQTTPRHDLLGWVRPTFQITTNMYLYEDLLDPLPVYNFIERALMFNCPVETPDHQYYREGGGFLHKLVRAFSPMMYTHKMPNDDFSARHIIKYKKEEEDLVNNERFWPSGGYINPFYAGFKVVILLQSASSESSQSIDLDTL